MVRCESDWTVKVSVVMKTEEVFMVMFWPTFKWIFRVLVSSASVAAVFASI